MPSFWSLLHASIVDLLGWTLLHFVWQGALVAVVLAGALSLLRDHAPRVRYAVSCVALVALLALPVATGAVLSRTVLPATSGRSIAAVGTGNGENAPSRVVLAESSTPADRSWRGRAASWVRPALPWIVFGWGLGVLVFAVRLGGGAWRVRRLRRTSGEAPPEWQERLQALAEQMNVRASVALRRSDRVEGPVLAGWWRPVILVPAGLLSGFPPSHVEALLRHELAHVRRHDVLVGRLQAVVETLLFFHPATWWTSRQIRKTREACCDDLAVRAGADRAVYAKALTALAERAVAGPRPGWGAAAADGTLLERIRRLVGPADASSGADRRLSMWAAALLMIAVPAGLAACASQQSVTGATASGGEASARGGPTDSSPAPPSIQEKELAIVSVRDDSSRRVVTIRGPETVEINSLDNGSFVLRYEGESVDTLRVPGPESFEEERTFIDPDSLDRHLRGLRLRSDSLERVILGDVNPDSLTRLIQNRFNADSLKRVLRDRFDLDSLAHRALEVRWQADSLARVFGDRFSDGWPPDSTFDADKFEREDFEFDLDVDSLIRRHQHRADSLRRHLEQMRETWERQMPERLREQARRLRERAERLEERAEEMEERSLPPTDSSASESGTASRPEDDYTYRFALKDFRVRIDGKAVEDGGLSMRGDGYFWVRGPEAIYVFAAQPFDGAARVGTYQGRVLSVTVDGHDVEVRSTAPRPIYVEEDAPAYGIRIPLTELKDDVSKAGTGTHLSAISRRFASAQ